MANESTPVAIPRFLKILLFIWVTFMVVIALPVVWAMLTVRQTGGVGAVSAGISEAIVEAFLIGLVVFVASWVGLRLAHRQSNRRERSR